MARIKNNFFQSALTHLYQQFSIIAAFRRWMRGVTRNRHAREAARGFGRGGPQVWAREPRVAR